MNQAMRSLGSSEASTSRGVTNPDQITSSRETRLKSRTKPKGRTFHIGKRSLERSREFSGPFVGPYMDTNPRSFGELMRGPEFEGDLRYDTGGPARSNRLRQVGDVGSAVRKSALRKAGKAYRMTGRAAIRGIKSHYNNLGQELREYPGRELVERSLEDMKGGEQHFDMMHDGGSTGLGGDDPCPPGMVMRDGVCVPMK